MKWVMRAVGDLCPTKSNFLVSFKLTRFSPPSDFGTHLRDSYVWNDFVDSSVRLILLRVGFASILLAFWVGF